MKEIWKDIKGYEGLYQVSNWGNVKSTQYYHGTYERTLKPTKDKDGYLQVILYKDGKRKMHRIHRTVAEAFIPNPDNLPQINHRDENPSNNRVDNIEWCDCKYNINYGTRTKKASVKKSKTVYQYTMDRKFIKEWQSAMEVERELGFYNSYINRCCNGKRKSAYKYIWKYE